jgi:hypothetical protein
MRGYDELFKGFAASRWLDPLCCEVFQRFYKVRVH